MSRSIGWLISPFAVLKFSQMLCMLLVIVFFMDGRGQWIVYNLAFLLAFAIIIGSIVSLALHYYDANISVGKNNCLALELTWNVIGAVLCFVTCSILAWDWWKVKNRNTRHHSRGPPVTIGEDGWIRMLVIVTVTYAFCSFLFICSAVRVRKHGAQ